MRFMMFVNIPTEAPQGEWEPSADMVAEMARYNEELLQAGAMLAGDGLTPPSEGTRLEWGESGVTVTDGPYSEAKEVVGGYWIIQTRTQEEAVEWAKRVPFGPGGVVELRRITELSDFPEDVQEAGKLSAEPPEQTKSSL